MMISETFCILPWIHVSLNIVGTHRLCCHQSHSKKDIRRGDVGLKEYPQVAKTPIENVWNSESYVEVRKKMIRGEPIDVCSKCYREEKAGVTSHRQSTTAWFSSDIPEIDPCGYCSLDSIRYLDIKFGNKCNLKCRMCNAGVSSAWIPEEKKYHIRKLDNIEELENLTWCYEDMFWDNLQKMIKSCTVIHIAGGEPLFEVDQQIKFLKMCIDEGVAKNIDLKYNTNLTMDFRIFEKYWRLFSSVTLKMSIDGFGKVNDYIRYPSKWKTISKNLKASYDLSQRKESSFKLQIFSTVGVYNIFDMVNLFEYLKQFKVFPSLNILNDPRYYNLKVLPENKKEKATVILREWYSNNIEWLTKNDIFDYHLKIEKTIEYMCQEDWSYLFPTFLKQMHKLDRIRNQRMEDYIPEVCDE